MRYLIAKKQHGEGCDYTIGCGMTYRFEEFNGQIDEASKHFADEAGEGEDLSEFWIVPADAAVGLDLAAIAQKAEEAHEADEKRKEAEREMAEFERLRRKFRA